tara:strand:- start:88 stop:1743 length:1656 start_codon:yes stop_codon:yes gene_type:complete
MKVSYINFWDQTPSLGPNDFWLSNFCKTIFSDVQLVHHTENPDILFCSNTGPINNIINTKAKIKVFFTGENLKRYCYREYNNEALMDKIFDIRLGFHFNDIKNKKIRLPLWLIYYNFFTMDSSNNFMTHMLEKRKENSVDKKILGSLVCRHDWNGGRTKIFRELSKYGKVGSAGSYLNNGIRIGNNWQDKINFIKLSKFSICPENSADTGYCTEKIMHTLEAGCIPLYWGIDLPEKDILKENCYCFMNIENTILLKQQIAIATQKDIKLDIFTKQAPYVLDNYYKTLEWQLKAKLRVIEKQKIYGISYASRRFHARQQKATVFKNSGYFDDFKMYNENDISNKFKENNKEIWYNSKRGGGWWIWKPYIIYEKLKAMMDNDVLVYFDAGCQLCSTIEAKTRFNQYIEMVNNHWTGHLRFLLSPNCQEKKYTNQYTINYFEKRYNTKMDKYISNEQLMATVHIIRKTKFTMDFFKEVLSILEDNKHLFDETYTQRGENHRHDQSIMSLLYKLKGGNLIIKDETWFGRGGCLGDAEFGSSLSKKYPIWATRFTT